MRSITLLFLALLFSTMIFAQEENQIPLTNPVRFNHLCMTSPSSLTPCISVNEGGIKYSLAFESSSMMDTININQTLKVVWKSTKSQDFKTPEGYTIENTYANVKEHGKLQGYPGWAYYVELPSGWCAAFFDKNSSAYPKETDKITFFFKRYK